MPDRYGALDRFIELLNWACHTAGQPSYAQMEILSAHLAQGNHRREVQLIVLSHSNTQQILAGQRRSVPKWPWVLTYVLTLQAWARRAGIPPESIGTTEEWKRRHEATSAAVSAATRARSGTRGVADRPGDGRPLSLMVQPEEPQLHGDADAGEDGLLGETLELIRRAGAPQWWDEHGPVTEGLALYLNLESIATRLRAYEPGVVPSLLQTEEYAHAVLSRHQPSARAGAIARQVELRLRRQRRLDEAEGCQLWAVVEERALTGQQAGRAVMRRQIRHLIDMAGQQNITLGVLPPAPASEDNATIREPITIFRFAGRLLGDVVCLGQPGNGLFLHKHEDTAHYSALIDILAIRTPVSSLYMQDLLRSILKQY